MALDQPMPSHKNGGFAAPVLAAAAFLFSFALLIAATTLGTDTHIGLGLLVLAPILPLIAALGLIWKRHVEMADWLWASFVATGMAMAVYIMPETGVLAKAHLWGIGAGIALMFSFALRSKTCLWLTSGFSLVWVWSAYSSTAPVDFLWPFLVIFSIGAALAYRQANTLAAVILALTLALWSGFTMQAAIALHAAGSMQIAFMGSMFLLVSALIIHATQPGGKLETKPTRHRQLMNWTSVTIVGASAMIAGFAVSPYAALAPIATGQSALYLWIALSGLLLSLGLASLIFLPIPRLDKIGIAALLAVLGFGVFIAPVLNLPLWWQSLAAGVLSIAGIWLATRGFLANNQRTGILGLAIWGASVLLSAQAVEFLWVRALIMALFALVAVGFYLVARQQMRQSAAQNISSKNQS